MEAKHTPGPWYPEYLDHAGQRVVKGEHIEICTCWHHSVMSLEKEMEANARLIAAAPDMLEALSLHQAWADSERSGPDYGGQNRDTHPDGEQIWRRWWDGNLDLCDRANSATAAALAKARGETP